MKNRFISIFLTLAMVLAMMPAFGTTAYAAEDIWYVVRKMNSFVARMDPSGSILDYSISFSCDVERGNRTVMLLSVPEQYADTLTNDEMFGQDNLSKGTQYRLPEDPVTDFIGAVFTPSDYEGVLSNEVNANFPVSDNISVTFNSMKLYSDQSKGLDTDKSYSVFFVLRTPWDGSKIFRNTGYDNVPVATLLPVTITLKKQNLNGTYTDTVVKSHVVGGSTLTYDTWPVEDIAGSGYFINATKSTGAGTVVAQTDVGSVTSSDRKAQDVVIYYDLIKTDVASITKGDVTTGYDTVQKAVNAAESGDTVVMIADSTENVVVAADDELTLDLNGYVLTGTGSDSVIKNEGTLTIQNSESTAVHNFKVGEDGLWTLTSDTKTVDYEDLTARPEAGTVVAVKGGCITGGSAESGGGIDNYLVLEVSGGNIVGNNATGTAIAAGGVYNKSTFTMTGGRVIGNITAGACGGVGVWTGTFNFSGGEISYNTAKKSGGGVYVGCNSSDPTPGVLNMSGTAKICYNKANQYSAAIGVNKSGCVNLLGGEISGNESAEWGAVPVWIDTNPVTVGGSVKIKDNISYGKNCNLYIDKDKTVTVADGFTGSIGVTTVTNPQAGIPVPVTGSNSSDFSNFFTSDNDSYVVTKTGEDSSQQVVLSNISAYAAYVVPHTKNADGTPAATDRPLSGNYSYYSSGFGSATNVAYAGEKLVVGGETRYYYQTIDMAVQAAEAGETNLGYVSSTNPNGVFTEGTGGNKYLNNDGLNPNLGDYTDTVVVLKADSSTIIYNFGYSYSAVGKYGISKGIIVDLNGNSIAKVAAGIIPDDETLIIMDSNGVASVGNSTEADGKDTDSFDDEGGTGYCTGSIVLSDIRMNGTLWASNHHYVLLNGLYRTEGINKENAQGGGLAAGNIELRGGYYIYNPESSAFDIQFNASHVEQQTTKFSDSDAWTESSYAFRVLKGAVKYNVALDVNTTATITKGSSTYTGQTLTKTYGVDLALPMNLYREGYALLGWAKSETASAPDFTTLLSEELSTSYDADTKLYAVWKDVAASIDGSRSGGYTYNDVTYYTSLQAAIDDAQEGDTVKLLVSRAESVTVASGPAITLDLNGMTLTPAAAAETVITNNGTLTLTDTCLIPGKITGGAKGVEQNGTLTLAGNATIADNTANLYLPEGKVVIVDDDFKGVVGVTTGKTLGASDPQVAITSTVTEDFTDKLISDNSGYFIKEEGNVLYLVGAVTAKFPLKVKLTTDSETVPSDIQLTFTISAVSPADAPMVKSGKETATLTFEKNSTGGAVRGYYDLDLDTSPWDITFTKTGTYMYKVVQKNPGNTKHLTLDNGTMYIVADVDMTKGTLVVTTSMNVADLSSDASFKAFVNSGKASYDSKTQTLYLGAADQTVAWYDGFNRAAVKSTFPISFTKDFTMSGTMVVGNAADGTVMGFVPNSGNITWFSDAGSALGVYGDNSGASQQGNGVFLEFDTLGDWGSWGSDTEAAHFALNITDKNGRPQMSDQVHEFGDDYELPSGNLDYTVKFNAADKKLTFTIQNGSNTYTFTYTDPVKLFGQNEAYLVLAGAMRYGPEWEYGCGDEGEPAPKTSIRIDKFEYDTDASEAEICFSNYYGREHYEPTVVMNDYTYGGTMVHPTIIGKKGTGFVSYYYRNVTSSSYTIWSLAMTSTMLKAGTYEIYAKVTETEDFFAETTPVKQFVVSKASVDAPVIGSKVYTGETLTADVVTAGKPYSLVANYGGVEAGQYNVFLSLNDPANYEWSDDKINPSKTLKFLITQANNSWAITPAVSSQTYGTPVTVTGAALYGNSTLTINYTGTTADGSAYSSSDVPTQAGIYSANFAVAVTDSYKGLSADVPFTISRKQLTAVGTTVAGKVYDATTPAAVSMGVINGIVGDDTVTVTATGAFADKKVGEDKAVSVSYELSGADAANYVAPVTMSTSAEISPATITVKWTNTGKVYNGSAQKPDFALIGVLGSDDISVTAIDKVNAGSYKLTAVLSGTDSGNYTLTNPNVNFVIEKAPVVFNVSDNTKQADGTPKAAVITAEDGEGTSFTDFEICYKDYASKVVAPVESGVYGIYAVLTGAAVDNYRHATATDGGQRRIGTLTLYDGTVAPATYTVKYVILEGRAGGTVSVTGNRAGDEITMPVCTVSNPGYTFAGWSLDEKTYRVGETYTMESSDVTFKALWTKDVYTIGGTVFNPDGTTPQEDAVVTLMSGPRQVGQMVTGVDGRYQFTNVLPGLYNLVVTYDGTIVTTAVEITALSVDNLNITLPAGRTNSVVEVAAGSPEVIVSGLEKSFDDTEGNYTPADQTLVNDGGSVEFKLDVEEIAAPAPEKEAELSSKSHNDFIYLNLDLSKTTIDTGNHKNVDTLYETDELLAITIPLPAELQGRSRYRVFRYHSPDGTAANEELTELPQLHGGSLTQEGFIVDDEGKTITVYAKNFSLYAITYENVSSGFRIDGEATENGKLIASAKYSAYGRTITVTAVPDKGYQLKTLTVTDIKGNVIELTELKKGENYTFVMPLANVTLKAEFEKKMCEQDENCVYYKYTDSDVQAWYHDGVHFCVERGYMVGMSETRFAPNGTLTRAQIVTMLWNMEGQPFVDYAMSFEDVPEDQWYTEAVRWAQSTGVVKGHSDIRFAPSDNVTREQLAAILMNYAIFKGCDVSVGEDTNILSYDDAIGGISSWAYPAMQWAVGSGTIAGIGNNLVAKGEASRAQAAYMIYNFCMKVLEK